MQLSDTRQVVERSLFQALRSVAVTLGYLVDINALSQIDISAVNQGLKQFTLNGTDLTNLYLPNRKFNVIGSTNNNGEYTIAYSAFTGGNTIITVAENISSSTADGKASIYIYYDDNNGVESYRTALKAIEDSKGFIVDIFGVGQPRAKYQKKIPRIVIIPNQSLPGALGGSPDPIFSPVGDPLSPDSYTSRVLPPQTVDLTYDAHLVSSTAEQSRVLHGILALAWPKRGYVSLITDPTNHFFVESFSYRNIPNPGDNIMEDVYMYKAGDVYETENTIVRENIAPITEITTDIKVGKASDPNNAIKFGDDFIITEEEE